MLNLTRKRELRAELAAIRRDGRSIALVPTMGNLHAGHIELVNQARARADFIVCTIFVNPLQFGAGEDLDAYPRTLAEDIAKLEAASCDCLFAPAVEEIYDTDLAVATRIHVRDLSDEYCGRSRPGHFDGVATIVSKLFNLVRPDLAVFGLKDYQQFLIIQKLVTDLEFDIELLGVEIQREASGLAMSSRNRYLSATQRVQAALIQQTLQSMRKQLEAGARDFRAIETAAKDRLSAAGFDVDYLSISAATTLRRAEPGERQLVILTAARLGPTRLLDNIRFALHD